MEEKLQQIADDVTYIKKRLFVGNGEEPFDIKIAKNTQAIGIIRWLVGIVLIALLGLVVAALV